MNAPARRFERTLGTGAEMTRGTKFVCVIASLVIGGLVLFPPRSEAAAQASVPVSRGFLFGELHRTAVPTTFAAREDGSIAATQFTQVSARVDFGRLTLELLLVLSTAAALGLLIQPAPRRPDEFHR